jgi:predicted site-specific integrase-resolvase
MKLSEWARKQGINYKTAWKWYKERYNLSGIKSFSAVQIGLWIRLE